MNWNYTNIHWSWNFLLLKPFPVLQCIFLGKEEVKIFLEPENVPLKRCLSQAWRDSIPVGTHYRDNPANQSSFLFIAEAEMTWTSFYVETEKYFCPEAKDHNITNFVKM